MTDLEIKLIQRAQADDIAAFERLVTTYDQQVLHLIFRMQRNLADAQDIYQDTFLKAFEKIGTFRFESEFRTWLFRIAINQCVNARRKKRLRDWLTFSDDPENPGSVAVPGPESPEHQFSQSEIKHQIDSALNHLSAQQRAIFILKHEEGYKIKEISELLNCAEGTVKNQLFRATRKLQLVLQPYLNQ